MAAPWSAGIFSASAAISARPKAPTPRAAPFSVWVSSCQLLPPAPFSLRQLFELRQRRGALILEQLQNFFIQTAIAAGVAIEMVEIDRAFGNRHGWAFSGRP